VAAQVLVLTAAAGVPDSAAAGLGTVRRLADTAVEVELRGPLPDGFAAPGCDANLVPAEGRRKRLLIADMDSTIIGVECIDELADFAGLKAEVATITEAAMRGELDFEGALIARVKLLEGLPAATLEECYAERVRLNPGAATLVRTMRALGAATALVSGGFSFFTERVAAAAGFARHQANRLVIADGRLTGEVSRPILGREAKLAALKAEAAAAGIELGAAVAVGDGANDLDMVRAAGLGVAYHAKPALAEAADARLDHSDLTAPLALQGIPQAEWRD
jgi:phosphoserine phosphatase